MFVSAIVVGAGEGKRLKSSVSKAILRLDSRPLIAYSLNVLNRQPEIKEIIVVGNTANLFKLRSIINKYGIKKANKVVLGGKARQDSVANGLKVINGKAEFVLIHDAARPFISKDLVFSLIKAARKFKAAVAAVPVKATTKVSDKKGFVKKTIDRVNLWEVQTPQVFSKDLILRGYAKFGKLKVTDDAMLVEKLGIKVKIVTGTYRNIKITTPEDFIMAKGLI